MDKSPSKALEACLVLRHSLASGVIMPSALSTVLQPLASYRRRQQDTLRIAQTLKSTLCHRSPLPFELKVGCI